MKTLKICVIATMITALIMLSCAVAFSANAEEFGEFYPRLSVVVERHADTVICRDKDGHEWTFYCDESDEWEKGDLCNLLMWNNSTDITEHEIIDVYWAGYTENIDRYIHMNGWR